MTVRTQTPAGAPIWIDLVSSDQDRTRAFYGALLGWDSEEPDPDLGNYLNFSIGGERVAGCLTAETADVWTVYLASDDAEKTAALALERGAPVHAPAMDVLDLGRMAVLGDPSGTALGVWQPRTHPGLLTLDEPGHAGWFELHTRDYAATLDFYREVFGWQTETASDTDDFRYTLLVADGQQLAGVMDATVLPEGSPVGWTIYFRVADADASTALAVELGGEVVHAPADTPFGRLATLRDATGASFRLIG